MPPQPQTQDPIKNSFYARWFSAEEKRYLKKSSPDGSDEITNLRIFAGRITRHLSRKDPQEYSDDDLKLLTQLVRISVGIGALQRGNASLQGKDSRVEKSIEEAIQNMEEDWSQA
jgi:hypothetical protein